MTVSKGLRQRKIQRQYQDAVGYLRTSREDGDTKQGIESQRLFIADYADRKGYTIVGWYQDDGVSGTTPHTDREGFMQAFDMCRAGQADIILVYDMFRVARDMGVFGNMRNACAKQGIKGYTTNDIEWTSDDAVVGFYMLMGEIERKAIAQRLYGGRRVRSRKDGMGSGTLPYGYTYDNGVIVIDDNAAHTVCKVLQLRESMSYSKTVEALNNMHISTPEHGTWGNSSIQRIEKNRALYTTGVRTWGDVSASEAWPIIYQKDGE